MAAVLAPSLGLLRGVRIEDFSEDSRTLTWKLPNQELAERFRVLLAEEAGITKLPYTVHEDDSCFVKLNYPKAKAELVVFACYLLGKLYAAQCHLARCWEKV